MADRDQGRGSPEAHAPAATDTSKSADAEARVEAGSLSSWAALADLEHENADAEAGRSGLLGLDDALLARLAAEGARPEPAKDPFEGSLAAPFGEAWLDEAESLLPLSAKGDELGTDDVLARDDMSELIDLDDLLDADVGSIGDDSVISGPRAAVDLKSIAEAYAADGSPTEATPEPELEVSEDDVVALADDEVELIEAEPLDAPPSPPPLPSEAAAEPVLLGEVPEYAPVSPGAWFPEGAPPQPDWSWGEGAGVAADLPLPSEPGPQNGRFRRLLKRLRHEIKAEADPGRLATLFHAYAVVAARWMDDPAIALEAARCAWVNDPTFLPARWLLDQLLADNADLEGRLHVFERGDAAALDRAGHLAAATAPDRALSDWGWAAEYDASALAPMLAALLVLYGDANLGTPVPTLEWALQRATSGGFWDVLGLEHVRLTMAGGSDPDWLAALDQLGDSPQLVAMVEQQALARENWPVLEALARKRAAGELSAADRRRITFARGWSLARLDRAQEAAEVFDALLEVDEPLAGLIGEVAREAGDAEREGRALSAEADVRPPGAWRAASLVARAVLAERTGDQIAAVAAWRSALAEDATCVPAIVALDRRARARGDLISVQDRAADEIEALEARLDGVEGAAAAAVARRLVTRYYRLARLLETQLEAPEVALDYHKRALGLAPDFAPALLALERIFATRQDWPALVALYLGRAARGAGSPETQVPWVLAAADVVRVHLGDHARAAKLYLRALKGAPQSADALTGAAQCLVAIGDHARAAVVVERLAALAHGAEAAELQIRAAALHEASGLPTAAEAALGRYQAALAAAPGHTAALDGVLRLGLAAGALAPIRALAARPGQLDALAAVQVAEALFAAGETEASAEFSIAWRAQTEALPEAVGTALRVIEARAAEQVGDWPAVVAALEGRAELAQSKTSAVLRARAAQVREFRLGDPEGALAGYEAALEADSDCVAARAGLRRLGPAVSAEHAGGPWWARAGRAPTAEARAAILEAEARLSDDASEVAALRTVGGAPQGESLEAQLRGGALEVTDPRASALDRYIEAVQSGAAVTTDALSETVADVARWRGAVDDARRRAAATLADGLATPLWSAGANAEAVRDDADAELDRLERLTELTPDDDARIQALAEAAMAAEDWPRLARVYARQLESAPPAARLSVARSLAALQAERFDDPSAAFETLCAAADEGGAGLDLDLRVAQYAERAGRVAEADSWFARATAHPDADDRTVAAHARAVEARGETSGAIALLDAGVARLGPTPLLLDRLAEARARVRDWRGVVRALLQLVELEVDDADKARRAMAIARILSRVTGDHRRAAGWYKRAVELDPTRLSAVWHMLAEADKLPAEAVPHAHLADALKRAREAQLARLADDPTQVDVLRGLHRLALAAEDAEAAGFTAEALHLVGADDDGLREIAQARQRGPLPHLELRLTPEQRAALAVADAGAVAAVLSAYGPQLPGLFGSTPAGEPTELGAAAQLVRSLAHVLGVDGLEVRLGSGQDGYAPHPVVVLAFDVAAAPLTPRLVFDLAVRVDALRGGLGAARRLTTEALHGLVRTLAGHLGLADSDPAPEASPVSMAALAGVPVPVGARAHVEAMLARAGDYDVVGFIGGSAMTSRRVGLLCCGSLGAALTAHWGAALPPDALRERLATDAIARDLFLFAVDPVCAGLRRSLDLAGVS